MRVQIYTKPGCSLCEEARDLLAEAKKDVALEVEEIDIYSQQALFDRYRYRIPVIRIGDTDVLELKFTLPELMKALQ